MTLAKNIAITNHHNTLLSKSLYKNLLTELKLKAHNFFLKILDQDIVILCLENQLHGGVIKEQK